MADYYLRPAGSNTPTSPYDTWEKAANSITTILALALTGSNAIHILNGTYTGAANYMALDNAKFAGLSLIGESRDGVIFDPGSSYHSIYISNASVTLTLESLTLKANGTGAGKNALLNATGASVTGTNVKFMGSGAASKNLVSFDAGAFSLSRCLFKQINGLSTNENAYLRTQNAATGSIDLCVMVGGEGGIGQAYRGIWCLGSGIVNINRSIVTHSVATGVLIQGGTVNIKDSYISGPITTTGSGTVTRTAGTSNTYNSLLLANPSTPTVFVTSPTVDTDNQKGLDPKFTSRRGGFIIPCIDDAYGLEYTEALEALLQAHNYKGTWFIHGAAWDSGDTVAARDILSRGVMEIASHSWSHNPADATTLGTISYTGVGTSPKYTIDLAAHTFSVSVTGAPTDNYTVNLAADNSNSFASVLATINANTSSHWGVTYSVFGSNAANGNMQISSLAVATAVAITTPMVVDAADYDLSDGGVGFIANEVLGNKVWLESLMNGITDPQTGNTYTCKTAAAPYNISTANMANGYKTAGFDLWRNSGTQRSLASQGMYDFHTLGPASFLGATVDETKTKVRSICAAAAENGMVVFMLAHTELECSTTADNGWKAILAALDEFSSSDVVVTSAQLMATTIKQSPWTYNSTTGVTSRDYAVSESDYHLLSSSPCFGAGISIPAIHEQATPATDLDGNIIHFLPPSIGPYDGQGDTKTITTTPYAPTGYEVRGTATSPAKINLGADNLVVDLHSLTADEYIEVKAGTKKVKGFVGVTGGSNQYLKGAGGSSSNGIFGSIFG